MIKGTKGRALQLRKNHHNEFTQELQERFLTLLSGTCNVRACAAEVGVPTSTIYGRRRTDPAFREAFACAQEQAVATLRAELVSRALSLLRACSPDEAARAALAGMDAKLILALVGQHSRALGREAGDIKPLRSDATEAAARLKKLMTRMRAERKRALDARLAGKNG